MQTKKKSLQATGKGFFLTDTGVKRQMETYRYEKSTIIEDQAWAWHFHSLMNGANPSPFDAVLKIARLFAEINDDFKAILDDGAELHIIADHVAERAEIERESIHGRLPNNKLRIVNNKIVGGLSEYFGHPIVAEVGKSTNGDWFCQISSGSFVYSTEHGTSAEEAANRALASSPADHLRLGMEILTEGEGVA